MGDPSWAICRVALLSDSQHRSLTSQVSATNKRALDFLVSVFNPAVEVPGSVAACQYCCKPCC